MKAKWVSIVYIIMRIYLGAYMVYGSMKKFKPLPTSDEVIKKFQEMKSLNKSDRHLKRALYLGGSRQTGYVWQFLGICELVFGLLLLAQGTSLIGALFLLPISINIFLYHLFLKDLDSINDIIKWLPKGGLFLPINIALILKEKEKWKHLLWIKPL